MAEKNYDIYAIGTGRHLGWTQGSPFGPIYTESGECTGVLVVHNPGSMQLIAVSQDDKSERKVNALPRNA